MATYTLPVRFRKLARDFAIVNAVPDARSMSFDTRFTEDTTRMAFVVVPQVEATPTAAQIYQGKNAADGTPVWKGSGKLWKVGSGKSIFMEGPTGLIPFTAYKLCGVLEKGTGVYGSVSSISFTTLDAAPQLIKTTPSNGWNFASPSSNITLQFGQPVKLGTGTIILRNVDEGLAEETFNVETGIGSNTGTVTLATTVYTNDTVVINPGNNLTHRRRYAVRIGASAVKSESGVHSYAGISDDTTYTFRAKYSDSNSKVALGSDEGFAFDLTDDSLFVKDLVTPVNNYDSTFLNLLTKTGTWAVSERGVSVDNSRYATMLTSNLPLRGTGGTLILDVKANEVRGSGGGGTSNHGPMGFYGKPGFSAHGLLLSKFDYGSARYAKVGVDIRNENNGYQYPLPEMGLMTFPMLDFGIVGVSWDVASKQVFVFTETASSDIKVLSQYGVPNIMTTLRLGYAASPSFFEIRRGVFLPTYIEPAAAIARAAALASFRSA
jgi:hypothetical protein